MSFSAWCKVVFSANPRDPAAEAQMDNLFSEDRVAEIEQLRMAIGSEFIAAGGNLAAAREAVAFSQAPLRDPNSALLGLIPSASTTHQSFEAVSFLTGSQIERHILPSFRGRAPAMPPRVALPDPLYARYPRRFLWATFADKLAGLTPRDVALALGLSHFLPGETVYRVSLGTWPDQVYIPTCMDSGIFEAWMRPSPGHAAPWGMTRHLITGASEKPELLVQVEDVEGRGLVAERVGDPGQVIDTYRPDLVAGRDLQACVA